MFKTIAELIDDVLVELGLVNGSAVQVYTEPQIRKGIETAYSVLFSKRFWKHLTTTTVHQLDGIVGVVTDANIGIADFKDIQWIKYEPFFDSCVIKNLAGEPYDGRYDYCYDSIPWNNPIAATKLIQFYPKDLGLKVAIRARYRTKFTQDTDIVPLDFVMLKHFVASNILANDGTNPSAEQRQNILFQQRFTDLASDDANDILYLSRHRPNTFTVAP